MMVKGSNTSNLQSHWRMTTHRSLQRLSKPKALSLQQAAAVTKLQSMWQWAKVKCILKLEMVGAAYRFSNLLLGEGRDAYLFCRQTCPMLERFDPKYALPTHKYIFLKVTIHACALEKLYLVIYTGYGIFYCNCRYVDYMLATKPGPHSNPLDWWKLHAKLYPTLAQLAKKYLCIACCELCHAVIEFSVPLVVLFLRNTALWSLVICVFFWPKICELSFALC